MAAVPTSEADVLATLARRLQGRRHDVAERAIVQLVGLGAAGDEVLALALPEVSGHRAALVAAALGTTDGEAGAMALRSALESSGPGTRDLRCAAILSLTKRAGDAATSDMVSCLGRQDALVREYALFCLAAVAAIVGHPSVVRVDDGRSGRELNGKSSDRLDDLVLIIADPARRYRQ